MEQFLQSIMMLKQFLIFDPSKLVDPFMIFRLVLQLCLFLGSAFFSGSETALFSLSRLDFQKLRKIRHPRSEILHELLDQPRRLIISILSGNELINIAATINMTSILVGLYGPEKAGWITTFIMVPLLLLFGEVTPKTIAVSNPIRISAGIVAAPLNLWIKAVAPLQTIIRAIADRITTRIVGEETAKENILQVDEFRSLVEAVENEGELDATERALIYNLLEANETEIVEIMTPRTRTAFIDGVLDLPKIVEQVKHYRHSRIPVYLHHHDNILGFLHAEDILELILNHVNVNTLILSDILHPPVVVPPTKNVDEMFDFFQQHNARAALVLNEFGGVEGFITMTDVLNFIFGEIAGKVSGQEFYQERDDNVYTVPGNMKLTHFNTLTNFGIEDPRMTTIGGVAFRYLDRLPKIGDKVMVEGVEIHILEMEGHRISQVRVSKGALEENDTKTNDEDDVDEKI